MRYSLILPLTSAWPLPGEGCNDVFDARRRQKLFSPRHLMVHYSARNGRMRRMSPYYGTLSAWADCNSMKIPALDLERDDMKIGREHIPCPNTRHRPLAGIRTPG